MSRYDEDAVAEKADLSRVSVRRPDRVDSRGGIERAVDELRGNVAEAEQLIHDLGGRLAPALRPEPPSAALGSVQDGPSTSVLAESVAELSGRLATVCAAGRALLDRVDL